MKSPTQELSPAAAFRPLLTACIAMALAGTVVLALCCVAYVAAAGPLLASMDRAVGEVIMEEAMRLQDAGALETARERYAQALRARFAGQQNRAFVLKRLGEIAWQLGSHGEAADYLAQAAAYPDPPLSLYLPWADALFHDRQYDKLPEILAQWRTKAGEAGNEKVEALAWYHGGRLAETQGGLPAAIRQYEKSAAKDPGGPGAAHLGFLLYKQGELDRSARLLETYLARGAAGATAAYARELLGNIRREAVGNE